MLLLSYLNIPKKARFYKENSSLVFNFVVTLKIKNMNDLHSGIKLFGVSLSPWK